MSRPRSLFVLVAGAIATVLAMPAQAQYAPRPADAAEQSPEAVITLVDELGKSLRILAEDLDELPQQTAAVEDNGAKLEFSGVSLVELLERHGVGFGDALKGKRAATVLIAEATDGYRVAIALAEFDPATNERLVLLATRCYDEPLPEGDGPFRLVIPGEKRKLRWIRMLRTLRVLNLRDVPLVASEPAALAPRTP